MAHHPAWVLVRRAAGRAAMVALCAGLAGACEPLYESWPARLEVPVVHAARPPEVPPRAALKVMTWNIKFAGGREDFWFDLWGDRVQMDRAMVLRHLSQVLALVRQVDPDLLLVQEIEVNARRSAYVNMVRFLLTEGGFRDAAYFSTWKSRYVPAEGLGRMDLGNAIFSKYPIVRAERVAQSLRTDQDPATRAFYLHRAIGRAAVQVGADLREVLVVHTEAYDTDGTKARQLREILAELATISRPFVIGGDFNAIPPGSVDRVGFNDEHPDSLGTDFAQPPYDLADMVPFYERYVPAISLADYGTTIETQRRHFTHSVIGRHQIGSRGEPGFWNRKLDYLFASAGSTWVAGTTDTLQEPGRLGITLDPMWLSDHCPVVGVWQVGP